MMTDPNPNNAANNNPIYIGTVPTPNAGNVITTAPGQWYQWATTSSVPIIITTAQPLEFDFCEPPEEKVDDSSGHHCEKCNEFNEYAKLNTPENTFVCYKCKHGY
jgi:hypothetical protein